MSKCCMDSYLLLHNVHTKMGGLVNNKAGGIIQFEFIHPLCDIKHTDHMLITFSRNENNRYAQDCIDSPKTKKNTHIHSGADETKHRRKEQNTKGKKVHVCRCYSICLCHVIHSIGVWGGLSTHISTEGKMANGAFSKRQTQHVNERQKQQRFLPLK